MIITDKMIRELQRRVDVSYEDAERYLRRAGGNIDMAQAYAIRKQNSLLHRLFRGIENLINTTFIYRLKVYKKEEVYMDMPIFLFLVLLVIIGIDRTITVGVIFIIIALVTECQLKLHKIESNEKFHFYRTVKKESHHKNETNLLEEEPMNHNQSLYNEDQLQANDIGKKEPVDIKVDSALVEKKNTDDEENDDYFEVTIDK